MIEIKCGFCSKFTYINFLTPKKDEIIKIDFENKSIEFVCPICNQINIITQTVKNRSSIGQNLPSIKVGRI